MTTTTTTLQPQTKTPTPKKLKCASPATADPASCNAQLKFPQGSKVEIKIDEEGFRGAWYGATVVEIVSPARKKKRKKEDTEGHGPYLVEYDTLLAREDDPTEPLRETAHISSIRPVPPSDDEESRVFGLYDVVDAFHRDGWWTGVVTRVGGENGGPKFAVFFQSPPEEIEFDRYELRLHREWIDGKWNLWRSGAANQEKDGTIFSIGTDVEVSLDEGEVGEVWFHAVLLGEIGNDAFVVECYNSGSNSNDEASRRRVTVDALHIRPCPPITEYKGFTLFEKADVLCGFNWSRGLITKIIKDGRYTILLDRTKEEKEVSLGDIRPCMDWTEGTWVITSKIVEPESGMSSQKRKRGTPRKSKIKGFSAMQEKGAESASSEVVTKDNPEIELVCLSDSAALKPRNVLKTYSSKRQLQRSMSGTEPLTPDTEDALRGKTSGNRKSIVRETPSNNSDDLPLLTWFSGKKPRSTVRKSGNSVDKAMKQCTNISGRPEEHALKSPVFAPENLNVAENNENLPFTKCFPIWATFERMDVFQKMPQKPHFLPLLDANESSREGLAIARMVTFANVAEAASKLQIGDSKRAIESNLEALSDLEVHGFKVDLVRDRLNELLSKKEERGKLLERLQGLHTKIEERSAEKSKIDEEVQELRGKIEELKAKIDSAESAAKKIDNEIAAMELEADAINRDVQSSQHDFERVVAAPW